MKGFKNQMSKYKLIQLTNTNIGAIEANSLLPLGITTRRYNAPVDTCSTFEVASSAADTLYITEPGYYKITYSAVMTAGAAGLMSVALITNQNAVTSVSEDVTAAEDIVNLTLVYVIRVCPNCCSTPNNLPVAVQFELGDVALGITPSPSTSNLIIEKVG
jgi:hypothetical protein